MQLTQQIATDEIYEHVRRYGPQGSETYRPLNRRERAAVKQYPDRIEQFRRKLFIEKFGWAIPTKHAIAHIVEFANGEPILEVGAGYGLWAKLIADQHGQVTATDLKEYEHSSMLNDGGEEYAEVELLDHIDATERYSDHPVGMLLWPMPLVGTEAVWLFRGSRFIAAADFCCRMKGFRRSLELRFELVNELSLPSWQGRDVTLTFWE